MNATVRPARGFTLIEMLIALVLAVIVLALALPAFTDSMRRSRRADAMQALQSIQHAQERYRANHAQYADSLTALSLGATSPGGHYGLSVADASASGYRAVALATGRQAADRDCARMWLLWQGGNLAQGGECADCASSSADAARCWVR